MSEHNSHDQNKEIINEIQDIQKEFENEHKAFDDFTDLQRPRYAFALGWYALCLIIGIPTLIFVLIFGALFSNNEAFYIDADAQQSAIEVLAENVNGIAFVDEARWAELEAEYGRFIYQVGSRDGIVFLMNGYFMFNETEFTIDDSTTPHTITLNNPDVIFSGEKMRWDNHAEIVIIVAESTLPNFIPTTRYDDVISASTITTSLFQGVVQFVTYIIVFVPLIFILLPSLKFDYALTKKTSKLEILSDAASGVVYVLAAGIAANLLSQLIELIFRIPQQISANQLAIERLLSSSGLPFIILTAIFIGPIVEEFIFRKSFFGIFKKNSTGLIVSSLVFGLIHITTELLTFQFGLALSNGIPYIAAGFIFGWIYLKSNKNIYTVIIAHMAYNALSIILSLFL